MVSASKEAGVHKHGSVRNKKARLAAERAARQDAKTKELENAEERLRERNLQLEREAEVVAKKLKAARDLVNNSTPRDPVPELKPKRRPNRRNKKTAPTAIDEFNLFMSIQNGKTVPGASNKKPGLCERCSKKLIGLPEGKLIVYRQTVPRPFTPAVQLKKMRIMNKEKDKTSREIRASTKYPERVNLAMTWYHLECLSQGQLSHIRKKHAVFGASVDRELAEKIMKEYELGELGEGSVNVDEGKKAKEGEDVPEGSGATAA